MLEREEFLFALLAPAITGKLAILAHDAMARHHQRQRIACASPRDRTYRPRLAQLRRYSRVAPRLATRNRLQQPPHPLLERSRTQVERKVQRHRMLRHS